MTGTAALSTREREILLALAQKVRLFSQRMLADHWFHCDLANTRRGMKRLVQAGYCEHHTVIARSLPELHAPLITWKPGDEMPPCGEVAYRCVERWRQHAARPTGVWIATEQTARLFGGVRRGTLHQPVQATHDLGVASVWLRFRAVQPQWATAWRSEDLLAHTRRGEKLPDAFLVNGSNSVVAVIEFGGGYSAERVAAFHEDCAARQLPYQLW
jgi:hypothetical protein